MKRPTDRRTVLITAGAVAFAAATGAAAQQSLDVTGAVNFKGGAVIPQGHIEIYLEDPAIQDSAQRRIAKTYVESDGGSRTIAFSVSLPAGSAASPMLQIVARLERADGLLVARGSAQFKTLLPVAVTLKEAIY